MQFRLSQLAAADRYKLMTATIVPRPIAWVTSRSRDGICNAAPYSFFNMLGVEPPIVALGLMRRPDGSYKDTARNIIDTGEFVVHLVCEADAAAMNFTCIDAPPEFDEIAMGGIETVPALEVAPPRIASAPVAMECRLLRQIDTSAASTIILAEVVVFHIDDRYLDPSNLHVDTTAMQLIGRVHGSGWYTRTADLFHLERPRYAK